jgi:hypothetical protein
MTSYLTIGCDVDTATDKRQFIPTTTPEFTTLKKPDILNEAIKSLTDELSGRGEVVSSTSHGFPSVAAAAATVSDDDIVVLEQTLPSSQSSADLYTLTLTDGSVVQLRVQSDSNTLCNATTNNVFAPLEDALQSVMGCNTNQTFLPAQQQQHPRYLECVSSPPVSAEITLPFAMATPPSSTSSSPASSMMMMTQMAITTEFMSPISSPVQHQQSLLLLASAEEPDTPPMSHHQVKYFQS